MPRTGLEPARLSARAPETRASTIPPPGHRVLVTQRYGVFLYCASQSAIFSFFIVREIGFYSKRQSVLIVRGCRFWLYGDSFVVYGVMCGEGLEFSGFCCKFAVNQHFGAGGVVTI